MTEDSIDGLVHWLADTDAGRDQVRVAFPNALRAIHPGVAHSIHEVNNFLKWLVANGYAIVDMDDKFVCDLRPLQWAWQGVDWKKLWEEQPEFEKLLSKRGKETDVTTLPTGRRPDQVPGSEGV